MDDRRFDALARRMVQRRSLLAALVGAMPLVRGRHADAAPSLAVGAVIMLTPSTGTVGSAVTATVNGFTPGEALTLSWFNGTNRITLGTATAVAGLPEATIPFVVPSGRRGEHRVRIRGGSGTAYETTFTVQPSAVIVPRSGRRGTTITAKIRGYAADKTISIRWHNNADVASSYRVVAQGKTNGLGARDLQWTVPTGAPFGRHLTEICASDRTSLANPNFTVCSDKEVADGAGGCCRAFKTPCTRNSDCCSGGCSQATGTCAAAINQFMGATCGEPGNQNSMCVGNYCDDDRYCRLIALPPGAACYSDLYCITDDCVPNAGSPARGYCV